VNIFPIQAIATTQHRPMHTYPLPKSPLFAFPAHAGPQWFPRKNFLKSGSLNGELEFVNG